MHIAAIASRHRSGGSGLIGAYTTGLWGAYALQKLLDAYVGSAIRVRRSSDNTEQDIGFSGNALDTASLLAFTGAANADANFEKLQFLCHAEGSNGGAVFTDQKGHGVSATAGSPTTSSTQAKFGSTSLKFGGTTDRIDFAIGGSIQLAAVDFKMGCWIYPLSLKNCGVLSIYGGSSSLSQFFMQIGNTSGQIFAGIYSGSSFVGNCTSANGAIVINAWQYVEYARSGNNFALSVNGTIVATATSSLAANVTTAAAFNIGGAAGIASFTFNGYIDEVQLYLGVAGHTSNFTAPTAALTNEGDGYITKYYDQSGAAHDFAQTALAKQPMMVSNASALSNIQWDGADDILVGPNSGTPTAVTALMTGKVRFSDPAGIWLELSNDINSNNGVFMVNQSVGGNARMNWAIADDASNRYSAQNNVGDMLIDAVWAGEFDRTQTTTDKRKAYRNGSALAPSVTGGVGAPTATNFAARPWNMGGRGAGGVTSSLSSRCALIYETATSDADIAALSTLVA